MANKRSANARFARGARERRRRSMRSLITQRWAGVAERAAAQREAQRDAAEREAQRAIEDHERLQLASGPVCNSGIVRHPDAVDGSLTLGIQLWYECQFQVRDTCHFAF